MADPPDPDAGADDHPPQPQPDATPGDSETTRPAAGTRAETQPHATGGPPSGRVPAAALAEPDAPGGQTSPGRNQVEPGAERPGWSRETLISARSAVERGLPGWPRPGETPPGPPVPVPPGRGGQQRIPRPFNARAGGPPPWAGVVDGGWRPTLTDLRAALAELGPAVPSFVERRPGDARPSAVLAPVYEEDGELVVVLTRRTWGLRTHQGEVSFPGGRVDPGESLDDAALREAKEEIDLDPSIVELIGELDHLTTISGASYVVPYVGALPGRPDRRPNPGEVDAVLDVPLRELADPAIFREEIWTFPGGFDRPIYFFELVGDTVWGMTAAMLRQLLGILTRTLGRGDLDH